MDPAADRCQYRMVADVADCERIAVLDIHTVDLFLLVATGCHDFLVWHFLDKNHRTGKACLTITYHEASWSSG